MLSTVILTHNESSNIRACLQSVSFSDQVIIVDDYSTDDTLSLARHIYPQVKIIKHHLHHNFAQQRNLGLSIASGDWVLFIDADEIVSPQLQDEILSAIKSPRAYGYYLYRQDSFLGTSISHGEAGHIKLLRLARQGSGQWARPVHEVWQVSGKLSILNSPLIHSPHPTISVFLDSINRYTTIDSTYRYLQGERFHLWQLFLLPTGKFLYNYFLKLGFLDGFPGLTLAYIMSLHSLLVRIKLYELQKNTQ